MKQRSIVASVAAGTLHGQGQAPGNLDWYTRTVDGVELRAGRGPGRRWFDHVKSYHCGSWNSQDWAISP